MRTLTRTLRNGEAGGQALPATFKALRELEVNVRTSEITMIAGVPGAGKSSLALALAVKSKVPTLYICADTAAWTMTLRLCAMLSGLEQHEVERRISADPSWAQETLGNASHIKWCFDSAPSLEDLDAELRAYNEVMGADPELIVVDNLIDVSDGEDEWGGLRKTMKELKFLARDTGAAVLLLHHTSEGVRYDTCPPRSSLQGKVAQLPAVILTVHSEGGTMGVSAVKNRYGQADPSGNKAAWLWFDAARMHIGDINQ